MESREFRSDVGIAEDIGAEAADGKTGDFVDSYRSFSQVVNRMQRQYLDLKDESELQARQLEEANESLRRLTIRNRAVTEFLNSILSSVSSGIVVLNRSGEITHFNAAAEELFGVKASWAVGSQYLEVVKQVDGAHSYALEALNGHGASSTSRDVIRQIRIPDGRVRDFLTGTAPLSDASGAVFGVVEVFQDVTEQRLIREEMSRMESLAAIGEMAASVAHQVRNPLVSVKGFASLIATNKSPHSDNIKHAQNILRGVGNLERVIDALLKFSRTENLHLKRINLSRYLRKVVRQFNERLPLSGKKDPEVKFQFSNTFSDSKLSADIDQIVFREIIHNLLSNAQESSGSPVEVNLTLTDGPPDAGVIEIIVSDNGPGMSREVIEQIFRPFFTTKSHGSGLGLALGKKLTAAHGGSISVVSAPGKGSSFCITLPAPILPREAGSNNNEDQNTE